MQDVSHMHNSETGSSSMTLDKRLDFLFGTKETAFVWERAGVTPFSAGVSLSRVRDALRMNGIGE